MGSPVLSAQGSKSDIVSELIPPASFIMKFTIVVVLMSLLAALVSSLPQGGGQGQGEDCGDELECLRQNIPGEPKQDYPIYGQSFLCKLNPKNPGCPGWGK